MTRDTEALRPTVHVVPEHTVPEVALGESAFQRVLLGASRDDGSPVLLGTTRVAPGRTTALIEARCWHAIRAGDHEVVMVFGFPGPDVPPTRHWPS